MAAGKVMTPRNGNGVQITCPLCQEPIPKLELVGHLRHIHLQTWWGIVRLLREMAEKLGAEVEA